MVLENLKVVVVHNDTRLFRYGFMQLLEQCPQLEEIHLSNCGVLNDQVISKIANCCSNLKQIYFPNINDTIVYCSLNDKIVNDMFLKCNKLEVVVLRKIYGLSFQTIREINKCSNLSTLILCSLQLSCLNEVTPEAIEWNPNLTELHINNCTWLANCAFLNKCPNLTTLDVAGKRNSALLIQSFETIITHTKNMTYLNFSYVYNFRNITGEQIKRLLQNCPNLRKLYMFMNVSSSPPYIHTKLHEVITNDTKLTELGLNISTLNVSCLNALKSIKTLNVVNSSDMIEWGK
jgi:hypothetical protein